MSYIDPSSVVAPRASLRSIDVLYNTGPGGWSAASVVWENARRIGIRWNGASSGPGVGNPQSRGNATWFIIPEALEQAVMEKLEELSIGGPGGLMERYEEMANDKQREREAEEWSEGLIGDSTAPG
jgi:hypothetical protein